MNSIPGNPPQHPSAAAHVYCGKKRRAPSPMPLKPTPSPACEPMDVSLNSRTANAVNGRSPVASLHATPAWLDKTVKNFAVQAGLAAGKVDLYMGCLKEASCKQPFIEEAEQNALKHVEWLQQRVSQCFADHGSANWQSCMDWLIRLTPADVGCQELLNLLPLELFESRPDLPLQLANKVQTIDELAAQARLRLDDSSEVCSDKYRDRTVNGNYLLLTYLHITSTLHYRFLQAAVQHAPLEKVEALLRHWLHDDACKDIALRLTAAPIHPTMITREEALLQDLLTLCATRLLQPTTRAPVGSPLAAADHHLVQAMANCDNKVSFGRTVGALGAGEDGHNLYLKCRRFNEQEKDFMAEPVMLSWLHATPLSLESATLKPHGTTTFRTLAHLFEKLDLGAKQKSDLTRTIVFNKTALVSYDLLRKLLSRHAPDGPPTWDERNLHPKNPYYNPSDIKTEQQLSHFLLNLPFPEQNRAAFIDDLLPHLDHRLRAHIVQQSSCTLSDEQHWQLLRATLPANVLRRPVTAYLFSTPADAHYHRYVTDSDLQSEASQALAERPQIQALRAYLRDYGRLFQQGVLGPPACNLFHRFSAWAIAYRFLYTSTNTIRPGLIDNFDGESSDHPNIGPMPMSLRDGGDACCITPTGWRAPLQSDLTELQQQLHWPGTVKDKDSIVESLASAWLGTVLLLGRILKAPTEQSPEGWFNSRDPEKESALADLLGHMVVDLFSYSLAVDPPTLYARVCEQAEGQELVQRCAREMQTWMSTAFTDHILDKTVPAWLYPDYTGKRENLLIPKDAAIDVRNLLDRVASARNKQELGVSYAALPLQGIEILTKKALAEAVLLASESPSATIGLRKDANIRGEAK